jgi:hypothetical protein
VLCFILLQNIALDNKIQRTTMGYGSLMHLVAPKEHQRGIHWTSSQLRPPIFLVLLIVSSIKQLFTSEYIEGDQQWKYISDWVAALCILKCACDNQSTGTMYWSLQPFFNLQPFSVIAKEYMVSGEYLHYYFLWIMWYFVQILVYNCCMLMGYNFTQVYCNT